MPGCPSSLASVARVHTGSRGVLVHTSCRLPGITVLQSGAEGLEMALARAISDSGAELESRVESESKTGESVRCFCRFEFSFCF